MTLLLARVRNRPWRRGPRDARRALACDRRGAAPPAGHVGGAPRSTSSVMPWPPAGWRTSKSPPWKVPVCVAPPGRAACSFTLPARVSTMEPSGIEASEESAAAWVAPGTRTSTLPFAGAIATLASRTGAAAGAGASSVPGSGDGATGVGRGAAEPCPVAASVANVTSSPSVTPRSLEATRRRWYVVPAARDPMPEVTVTGLSPLPALAGLVAVPYASVVPYSNQYVVFRVRGLTRPCSAAVAVVIAVGACVWTSGATSAAVAAAVPATAAPSARRTAKAV